MSRTPAGVTGADIFVKVFEKADRDGANDNSSLVSESMSNELLRQKNAGCSGEVIENKGKANKKRRQNRAVSRASECFMGLRPTSWNGDIRKK